MQSVESGKEPDDSGGWLGFFSSKKTEVRPTFDGDGATGSMLNNNCQQNIIPPEQQRVLQSPQPPENNNWNALNTADFYRDIPQMTCNSTANSTDTMDTSAYNMNPKQRTSVNSMDTKRSDTMSTSDSSMNAQSFDTWNTTANSQPAFNLNLQPDYKMNPPAVTRGDQSHNENQSKIAVPERKEAAKAVPSQEAEKIAKLEKAGQLMEAELAKLKESQEEDQANRLRRRALHRRQNRLRRRRHRKRQILFDPVPGLFPKVLVDRILKEREVEVIIHGPKGHRDIVRRA